MILYVVILLVLASFVFAFFSAKTWHWGYVILVEGNFLATLLFMFLAAETLRINAIMRSQNNMLNKQLTETKADSEALQFGTSNTSILNRLRNAATPTLMPEDAESIPSLENLDHELLLATRARGRVWRNVAPAGQINPATGEFVVNFLPPPRPAAPPADAADATPPAQPVAPPAPPAGIKADTVVYLFDDPPPATAQAPQRAAPQYLGEFNVVKSGTPANGPPQATLRPAQPLDAQDFELRRLAASRGPWIMYETMPTDRQELYTNLKEEQLKQILPKQSVDEYLRHNKEATNDDDPFRKLGLDADGKPLPPEEIGKATKVLYQRRLRDYAAEFDELNRRRIALKTEKEAVQKDDAQVLAAQEVANNLQIFRTDEKKKLTADLAGITNDREAIEKHLAQVEQLLAKARQLTTETMAQNRKLVAELAGRQPRQNPGQQGTAVPAKDPKQVALNSK
jgi:hypothetical protein